MVGLAGTLGLITARGGSKGLPRKNILPVAGHPLVAWTIKAALGSPSVSRVILSTDDQEIADVAQSYGCEVPFRRPDELSGDRSPHIDVVLHAVKWLINTEGWHPDWVLLLQPTSPARTSNDIEAAIKMAMTEDVDAVVSVSEAVNHPFLVKRIAEDGFLSDFVETPNVYLRRQDLPKAYAVNGAIYLVRTTVLLTEKTLLPRRSAPYLMPPERSIDVDTVWDLQLSDSILRRTFGS